MKGTAMSVDVALRWSEELQRRVVGGTLNRLSIEDWNELLWRARVRDFKFNDVMLKQGTIPEGLFILTEGEVRIERHDQGRVLLYTRLGPGAVLGEMSFLDQAGASADVVADGKVEVLFVETRDLAQLIEADQGFAARFYQSLATTLSRRLRATNELIRGRF